MDDVPKVELVTRLLLETMVFAVADVVELVVVDVVETCCCRLW